MKCLWKTMYYPLCSQSLLSEELIWIRMPLEPSSQNPSMQIAVIRHVVSGILLHNTIYDVVPLSSKGLALVPFWDDRQGTITGMLTASDFVLILRKLQRNIQVIGNEEPISAWKEAKLQFYGGPDGAVMQRTPLIHVLLHIFADSFI
ncbi:Sucrose nonfermenting 4-like protein [Zea mays]|uniref:Sucrose nonfermenting 4-like protein n=1 Tax=Zea mays TaxID=4577 RepID=A0A1D6FYC8_MAIZE|nr:Sucrose nonfermenting 4-like protein [Zea mays]